MRFRSVHAVTWTVPDVAASCAAFERYLGYGQIEEGVVSDALAAFWSAPAVCGSRYRILRPASGEPVYLRFIEAPQVPGYAPLKTYGWNAAEFHVRDVYAVAERLADSPFRIIGGPRDLLNNGAVIALQVVGPGDEVLYLTEMRHDGMREIYGSARSDVDRVFICVLGVSDQPRTLEFYRPHCVRTTERRAFPIKVLAAAHGLDPEQARFDIASLVMEQAFRIETDAYPASAQMRPGTPGQLPPGLAMVSVVVERIPSELTPITLEDSLYTGRCIALQRGPDSEWLELIQKIR